MRFKDYYAIIEVPRDASQEDIKRAYRRLARKYHPDVSKEAGAEERFKELQEAYAVLKDPSKRAAYDRLGVNWKAGEEFTPPPGWDFDFAFSDAGFAGSEHRTFSDFFDSLFGYGPHGSHASTRGSGFRMRGPDRHEKIVISLEDAYSGATRTVQLKVQDADEHGHPITHTRDLKVRIPPGVTQGQRIRLAHQGAPGIGGGPAGDLYLEVVFHPHRLFRPDGRNIHMTLPIAPWEAALGTTITVPTLAGYVDLRIPPGSQSGHRLRLQGRGLPGDKAGDQFVELRIVTPSAQTEAARSIYRNMAREIPFDPRAHLRL